MDNCLICSRDADKGSSIDNSKVIQVFHNVLNLPLLECQEFFSSSSTKAVFCYRCSKLLEQAESCLLKKCEFDGDLTRIRYKLVDSLINDVYIQSKEDLTKLRATHKERFILFHKMRSILNLDPREPSLSSSSVGITTYKNKKCILCGELKQEQKDENSFAIKILQDMKDVHKTLYFILEKVCHVDKSSPSSFCDNCCSQIIQGKTLIAQTSYIQEKLEMLEFKILNRLFNQGTQRKEKIVATSSLSNNEQKMSRNRDDFVLLIKKCLKLEGKQEFEETNDNQTSSTATPEVQINYINVDDDDDDDKEALRSLLTPSFACSLGSSQKSEKGIGPNQSNNSKNQNNFGDDKTNQKRKNLLEVGQKEELQPAQKRMRDSKDDDASKKQQENLDIQSYFARVEQIQKRFKIHTSFSSKNNHNRLQTSKSVLGNGNDIDKEKQQQHHTNLQTSNNLQNKDQKKPNSVNLSTIKKPRKKVLFRNFMCLLCDLTFKNTTTLHRHYVVDHGDPILWPCRDCRKTVFTRQHELYSHRYHHHKNLPLNKQRGHRQINVIRKRVTINNTKLIIFDKSIPDRIQ